MKIKLGNTPKTFKRKVTFDMLDGTKGSIEWVFKYMSRTDFGKFIDGIMESNGVKKVADEDGKFSLAVKFSLADLMEKTKDSNAEYIMKVAEGWDLSEDLNTANVCQLCDEVPAAAAATMEAFRLAVSEGRLGN